MSDRFLYDTSVFVYAVGTEHPYRSACQEIVKLAASGNLLGEASVELVQEFVHVRARRLGDRREPAAAGGEIGKLCRLHPVDLDDLKLALELFADSTSLHMRDALHAATALNRGIDLILSTDRAFDAVPGLERVDPLIAVARLAA